MRVNIGPGRYPLEGYENLDIAEGRPGYPLPYESDSVDEVRASHVLEHYGHREALQVLAEWVRVLRPGGVLKIAVPDFKAVASRYLAGERIPVQAYVMGGQTGEHDYHRSIYDADVLRAAMEHVGLTDIEPWPGGEDYCSGLDVSLNLQGRKKASMEDRSPYDPLGQYVRQVHSPNGEDGILDALIETLTDKFQYKAATEIAGDGTCVAYAPQKHGWQVTTWRREQFPDAENLARACSQSGLLSIMDREAVLPVLDNLMPVAVPIVVLRLPPGHTVESVAGRYGLEPVVLMGDVAIYLTEPIAQVLAQRLGSSQHAERMGTDYGKLVHAVITLPRLAFTDNMFALMSAILPLGIRISRSSGVYWHQCITILLEEVIAAGYEYALTVDYDSVFDIHDVRKLVDLMLAHPEADAIAAVQVRRDGDNVLITKRTPNGEPVAEVDEREFAGDLFEVDTAHFGLTIFRCARFARVERPWLIPIPDENGRWSDQRIIDGRVVGGRVDADIEFWHRWRAAGNTVYLANRVPIGHLQRIVTWPSPSLTAYHQLIHDWERYGKPAEGIWR